MDEVVNFIWKIAEWFVLVAFSVWILSVIGSALGAMGKKKDNPHDYL